MCVPNILINDLKQQQQWKQVRLIVVVKQNSKQGVWFVSATNMLLTK